MKDIKFRYVCYNKHFNEVKLVYLTDAQLLEVIHVPIWIISDNCEIRDKQLFSGMTDNNDKDIYEGDIVHDLKYPEQYFKIVFEDGKFNFEAIKPKSIEGCEDDEIEPKEVEVVGNIYENPELI